MLTSFLFISMIKLILVIDVSFFLIITVTVILFINKSISISNDYIDN